MEVRLRDELEQDLEGLAAAMEARASNLPAPAQQATPPNDRRPTPGSVPRQLIRQEFSIKPSILARRFRVDEPRRFRLADYDPARRKALRKQPHRLFLRSTWGASPTCRSGSMRKTGGRY
jgi:hypothetical protein